MIEIVLTDDAVRDLEALDRSTQLRVVKKLRQLEQGPLGQPLGQRAGVNLAGFRKIVVGNRQWRIIYALSGDDTRADVWVIGARSDDQCYNEAADRLRKAEHLSPAVRALADVLEQTIGPTIGATTPKAGKRKGPKHRRRRFPWRRWS